MDIYFKSIGPEQTLFGIMVWRCLTVFTLSDIAIDS